MSTLYAGPWKGEFGWELCWWNPFLRYLAKQYYHIIVAAPHNSRYLYEFADKFIPLETEGLSYCDGKLIGDEPVVEANHYLGPKTIFEADTSGPEKISTPREWRHLSNISSIDQIDIMCAFRPEKYIGKLEVPGKTYPLNKCRKVVELLIEQGLTVGCFGGKENYCPNGARDLRDKPLATQCGAISVAKCVVGPSSGTIHLASLCGCPHVTWIASIHHTLKQRYQTMWNPFKSPIKFIGHAVEPSPENIVSETLALIS